MHPTLQLSIVHLFKLRHLFFLRPTATVVFDLWGPQAAARQQAHTGQVPGAARADQDEEPWGVTGRMDIVFLFFFTSPIYSVCSLFTQFLQRVLRWQPIDSKMRMIKQSDGPPHTNGSGVRVRFKVFTTLYDHFTLLIMTKLPRMATERNCRGSLWTILPSCLLTVFSVACSTEKVSDE